MKFYKLSSYIEHGDYFETCFKMLLFVFNSKLLFVELNIYLKQT